MVGLRVKVYRCVCFDRFQCHNNLFPDCELSSQSAKLTSDLVILARLRHQSDWLMNGRVKAVVKD